MTGVQTCALPIYIGDSQRTTPKKSAPELTGSVSTDVSKNIYDLAGNCCEWTMEADPTNFRVGRGGDYSAAYRVSTRSSVGLTSNYAGGSFRLTLYIK